MPEETEQKFNILLLAGSRQSGDPIAKGEGKLCKAFVDIAGTPMIDRVLHTLNTWPKTAGITVSISKEFAMSEEAPLLYELLNKGKIRIIETGTTPCKSIIMGLKDIKKPVLVTTADHPLLDHQILDEFIQDKATLEADFTAAIAKVDIVENAYPQVKRTRLSFADGAIGGCNLFLFNQPKSANVANFWQKAENSRKTPIKLAFVVGFIVLLRYMMGSLRRENIIKRLNKLTKCNIYLKLMQTPEAAIDVDKKEDLTLVRQIFNSRQ